MAHKKGAGSTRNGRDSKGKRLGVKRKQVFQPLRVAVTGTTVSPGIFETVAVLGSYGAANGSAP